MLSGPSQLNAASGSLHCVKLTNLYEDAPILANRLDELGFHVDSSTEAFYSFKYGSC